MSSGQHLEPKVQGGRVPNTSGTSVWMRTTVFLRSATKLDILVQRINSLGEHRREAKTIRLDQTSLDPASSAF